MHVAAKLCPQCGEFLRPTVSLLAPELVAASTDYACSRCGYVGMVYLEARGAAEVADIRKEIAAHRKAGTASRRRRQDRRQWLAEAPGRVRGRWPDRRKR